jgi:hypothetical protein
MHTLVYPQIAPIRREVSEEKSRLARRLIIDSVPAGSGDLRHALAAFPQHTASMTLKTID